MSKIHFAEKVLKTRFGDFIPFVIPFNSKSVEQTSAFQTALAAARRQCDVIDVKNFTSNVRLLAEDWSPTGLAAARFQCDVIDVKNFTSRNSGIGASGPRRESVHAAAFLLKLKKSKFGKLKKGRTKINVQIPFCRKSFENPFWRFIPFVVPFMVHTPSRGISTTRNGLAAARCQCDVNDVKNFTSNVRPLAEDFPRTAFAAARHQCDVIDVKNFTSRNSRIGAFEGLGESVHAAVFFLKLKKSKFGKMEKGPDKNKCPKSVLPKKF